MVFLFCDRLGMSFPTDLGDLFNLSEIQAMGCAHRYAGRLKTLVDPVHAVIAFNSFTGFRVPLWGSPWAGGDTGLTANA